MPIMRNISTQYCFSFLWAEMFLMQKLHGSSLDSGLETHHRPDLHLRPIVTGPIVNGLIITEFIDAELIGNLTGYIYFAAPNSQ
jgi:hypothetical protein